MYAIWNDAYKAGKAEGWEAGKVEGSSETLKAVKTIASLTNGGVRNLSQLAAKSGLSEVFVLQVVNALGITIASC